VHTGRSIEGLTMSVQAFAGQPWRVLTSALLHADVMHLVFNVLWLWVFGTAIEAVWGPVRTFAIFVLFAAGSTLAEYAVFTGGSVCRGRYGLFGLCSCSRAAIAVRRQCDRRTVNLFAGWFVLCVVLTATHVMNIGNVAHGSGALLGILLGLVLSGRVPARLGAGAAIAACSCSAGSARPSIARSSTCRPTAARQRPARLRAARSGDNAERCPPAALPSRSARIGRRAGTTSGSATSGWARPSPQSPRFSAPT